jgi:hypothetical protein
LKLLTTILAIFTPIVFQAKRQSIAAGGKIFKKEQKILEIFI